MLQTLKKRQDFLRLQGQGRQYKARSFVCLGLVYAAPPGLRVGFTATKKALGPKAVDRNRAKRRLRAAVQQVLSQPAWGPARTGRGEVVLIARAPVLTQPFPALCAELQTALNQLWAAGL